MVLEAVKRSVDSLESLHSEEPVLKNRLVHLWVRKLLDMGEDGKKGESLPRLRKTGSITSPRGIMTLMLWKGFY